MLRHVAPLKLLIQECKYTRGALNPKPSSQLTGKGSAQPCLLILDPRRSGARRFSGAGRRSIAACCTYPYMFLLVRESRIMGYDDVNFLLYQAFRMAAVSTSRVRQNSTEQPAPARHGSSVWMPTMAAISEVRESWHRELGL